MRTYRVRILGKRNKATGGNSYRQTTTFLGRKTTHITYRSVQAIERLSGTSATQRKTTNIFGQNVSTKTHYGGSDAGAREALYGAKAIPKPSPPPAPISKTETKRTSGPAFTVTAVSHVQMDAKAIAVAVDKASVRVFGTMGAMIRAAALGLLRDAPDDVHAGPGEPPRTHATSGGLRDIGRFTDRVTHSLIVGPNVGSSNGEVPARLEYGEHPFMGPAYESVAPVFPALWSNSIH